MGELTEATAGVAERARREADAYRGDNPRPLGGYVAVLIVYGVLVALTTVVAAATGRKLPEQWRVQDLLTVTLGTHKLSRTLSKDAVTSPLRAPFAHYEGTGGPAEVQEQSSAGGPGAPRLGELITCPFCLDMWVATLFVIGLILRAQIDPPRRGLLYRIGRRRLFAAGLRDGTAGRRELAHTTRIRASIVCRGPARVPKIGIPCERYSMTANDQNPKQQQLDGYRVNRSTGYLTTQQGVRVDHTDDSLTPGSAARRCWRTSTSARRSPTSTTSASPSASSTPAARARTATSRLRVDRRRTRARRSCRRPASRRRCSCASRRWRGSRGSADTVRDVRGFATKFYTERGQLRPRRQQHPGLLHPGRHQVPRPRPRGQARAAQRDAAGASRRTTRSGTSSRCSPRRCT